MEGDQVVAGSMLERMDGDTPLVGEDRVAGVIQEDGLVPESLLNI